MGRDWVKRRKRDPYYRKAKAGGYRSRAAYKLLQIQDRFRVIRAGDSVVDLGAAPGGWSQVAGELGAGIVIAVDRVPMAHLEGVVFVQEDAGREGVLAYLSERIPEGAHVVLSDMAPKVSGTKSLDHARSLDLAERAYLVAEHVLREGGHFVTKLFQGGEYPSFRRRLQGRFAHVKGYTPPASPAGSAEIYLVSKGWGGKETP